MINAFLNQQFLEKSFVERGMKRVNGKEKGKGNEKKNEKDNEASKLFHFATFWRCFKFGQVCKNT